MRVASIFLGRPVASPIEIGKISRRSFAAERRRSPALRGRRRPRLQDGHSQPVWRAVHPPPATLHSDTFSALWKGERIGGEGVAHLAAGLKPRPSEHPK